MKVLFTDLDDTFYHPADPTACWEVHRWCQANNWRIAIVTGLGITGYQARVAEGELPAVDAVAAHVGTDMWYPSQNGYARDEEFNRSAAHRQFDRPALVAKGNSLITQWKKERPNLQFDFQQPADPDQPYKVSFYITLNSRQPAVGIRQELAAALAPYPVIISDHTAYNRAHPGEPPHYCVDVVPITKTGAVNYLIKKWSADGGIVAGDSGNDIDMLLTSPANFVSVLVGGAKPEARQAVMAASQATAERGPAWRRVIGQPGKWCYLPTEVSLTPAILEACALPK